MESRPIFREELLAIPCDCKLCKSTILTEKDFEIYSEHGQHIDFDKTITLMVGQRAFHTMSLILQKLRKPGRLENIAARAVQEAVQLAVDISSPVSPYRLLPIPPLLQDFLLNPKNESFGEMTQPNLTENQMKLPILLSSHVGYQLHLIHH